MGCILLFTLLASVCLIGGDLYVADQQNCIKDNCFSISKLDLNYQTYLYVHIGLLILFVVVALISYLCTRRYKKGLVTIFAVIQGTWAVLSIYALATAGSDGSCSHIVYGYMLASTILSLIIPIVCMCIFEKNTHMHAHTHNDHYRRYQYI
jgi:uncharacterized membrane protein